MEHVAIVQRHHKTAQHKKEIDRKIPMGQKCIGRVAEGKTKEVVMEHNVDGCGSPQTSQRSYFPVLFHLRYHLKRSFAPLSVLPTHAGGLPGHTKDSRHK